MKRRFRIVLIRSKGEVLGMVEATDAQATREKVAAIGCWCRSWAENELSGKARQAAAASSESSELLTYVPPPQDLTWRAPPVCGPRVVSCKFTRLMPDCCTRPARGRPEPIPISGQVRVVLDGQGLQTGGHLKQFFLDHQFGCNLGEPPTFGGFLAQEIFEIRHRISRRLCRCASWSRSGREDRTAGSENPTVTWRITWSSATIALQSVAYISLKH